MRLFLLRHVEAQSPEEVERDEERAITSRGENRLRKACRGLRRLDIFPDRILSSPFKRAIQTAEVAADELGFPGEIEAVEELSPESDPAELMGVLRTFAGVGQVLIVGHQPFLGRLVGHLIGAPQARVGLKKGGLARIDVEDWGEDPPGQLRWLFTLKQLSWLRKKKGKGKKNDEDLE